MEGNHNNNCSFYAFNNTNLTAWNFHAAAAVDAAAAVSSAPEGKWEMTKSSFPEWSVLFAGTDSWDVMAWLCGFGEREQVKLEYIFYDYVTPNGNVSVGMIKKAFSADVTATIIERLLQIETADVMQFAV